MRVVILIVIITVAVVVGVGMLWVSGGTPQPAPVSKPLDQPQAASQVATVDVLVARQDIQTGTVITEALVDRQPWPSNLVLEGFMTGDAASSAVIGMVARGDFKTREPLISTKLARKEDASFLASSLGSGMRAVTVAVDPISGVGGYLFPGDRVDVILTHGINSENAGSRSGAFAAEVLMPDVRVLAVNNRKNPQAQGQGRSAQAVDDAPPANVTLELTQQDAKRLRLSEKNGTLSLALRSLEDRGQDESGAPISLGDITHVNFQKKSAPAPKVAGAPERVNILRGGIYGGAR
jgi:pilus assembly protein CpaB